MIVRAGNTYKARNGRVIGPMLELQLPGNIMLFKVNGDDRAWYRDGTCMPDRSESPHDLILSVRSQVRENATARVIAEVVAERVSQDALWGGPEHDDEHTSEDWTQYIDDHLSEYQEAALGWPKQEDRDLAVARKALIQIAALAVAAVESLDRMTAKTAEGGRE